MDDAGIAAMDGRQAAAQTVGVGRDEDQVDMVGRQHPAPYFDPSLGGVLRQQVAVELVVRVTEERLRPAIATLCHRASDTLEGHPSHARHIAAPAR